MSYFSIHATDPARQKLREWSEANRAFAKNAPDRELTDQTAERIARLLWETSAIRMGDFDPISYTREYSDLGIDEEEIERRIRFRMIRDLRTDLARYERMLHTSSGLSDDHIRKYEDLSAYVRSFLTELNNDIENGEQHLAHIRHLLGLE